MMNYYFWLAWLSLRKTPFLSLLMVIAIATGIAACLTMVTLYSVVSGNPLAHKNERVFAVQLDSWDPDREYFGGNGVPLQLTYRDAKALYDSGIPDKIVIMRKAGMTVQKTDLSGNPSAHSTRMTTRDFFSVFDVEFKYGGPWSQDADVQPGKVAVITEGLNNRLFGGRDSIGETVLLERDVFRVVGVVADDWRLVPAVYDLSGGYFADPPEVYVPLFNVAEKEYESWGSTEGWTSEIADSYDGFLQSENVWLQAWVGLNSLEKQGEFEQFLKSYIEEQKQIGRFQRPLKYHLNTPEKWLNIYGVVSDDDRVLLALSFAFLLICLINTMVLLLAKFLKKAPEAGIRRALGASQEAIFIQHLAEAFLIGVAGGVAGLLLSWLGLSGVRSLYNNYHEVALMNGVTVAAALLLALLAALASGVLPAWRISCTAPARYLKAQ